MVKVQKTIECISDKYIFDTTRFRYRKERDFEKAKNELIIDNKKRHEGRAHCTRVNIIF